MPTPATPTFEAFSAPGFAFGDFGTNDPTAGLAAIHRNTRLLQNHPDNESLASDVESINSTFACWEGGSLPSTLADIDTLKTAPMTWLVSASDTSILGLMKHLNARHQDLKAAFIRDADYFREFGWSDIQNLAGYYAGGSAVAKAAGAAIERLGFGVLDALEAGRLRAIATCLYGPNAALNISLGNLYKDHGNFTGVADDEYLHVVRHEGIHAGLADLKAGFVYEFTKSASLLNEEIGVEHAARASKHGDFDSLYQYLSPSREHIKSYDYELAVFAGLCVFGRRPITAELICDAQASPRNITPNGSARHELQLNLNDNIRLLLPRYRTSGYQGFLEAHAKCNSLQRSTFLQKTLATLCTQARVHIV